MEGSLRLVVTVAALILLAVILFLLGKGKIPVKFSILWGLIILALLFVALIPNFMIKLMNLMGFQTLSNMLIGILIFALFFMLISLTVIVSGQKTKIQLLIQEVSILKQKADIDGKKE
ncbi:MAG: DUF2304 domain-containing protein [Bacilli bacterium]